MKFPGLIGKKIEMSQIFLEDKVVPVTILQAGPCSVTQIKTEEKDGYYAIQIGFGNKKPKRLTKPLAGHLKNIRQKPKYLKEIKIDLSKKDKSEQSEPKQPEIRLGEIIRVSDVFITGDKVDVTGNSKGKGFTGVIKRWGFRAQPRTHGQSDKRRAPGSIGAQTPGRVFPGKKLPGRKGNVKITVKGLEIMEIDKKNNLIKVKGAVPGHRNTLLIIKKSKKK